MLKSIQACSAVILIFCFSLLLSSCSRDDDAIIGPKQNTVAPLYPANGANWNDYVKDDGADFFSASDSACNPAVDTACIHGGQMMSMEVPGKSSCDGLTANDAFQVFEWTCDDSVSPVRFVTTGFKTDQGLSDLIDFNTSAIKENYLEVWEAGSIVAASLPATWWANTIVANNDGSDGTDMNAGEIHIITQNVNATYTIGADWVALLVKPGVVLTGSVTTNEAVISATNRNFIWLEGTIDAAGDDFAIHYDKIRFSAINKVTAINSSTYGVHLVFSSNNTLSNVTASSNTSGVWLDSSSNNTLSNMSASSNGYGVYLGSSTNNTLSNVSASSNTSDGVYLDSSTNNTLSNVSVSSNDSGVTLASSSNNTLSNITASSNDLGVLLCFSSNNNTMSNVTASSSDVGVYLFSSSNNTLSNVTASSNDLGVFLNFSGNNTLSNVTASNNGYGVYLSSSSNNRFTVQLKVGTNSTSDCNVSGGVNPGLINGTCSDTGVDDSNTYGTSSSDATLTTGVTVATSFVNPAVGDYSLQSTDTTIRDVLALPTGTETLIHTWSDTNSTEMLRNAVEIQDDGIGNDNLLCESNETCLYTPNIAAYQGHGNLVSAGTFTDGTIFGVILMRYKMNGY